MEKGLGSKLDSWLHGKIYFTTIGWLNAMSQSAKRPTLFLTQPLSRLKTELFFIMAMHNFEGRKVVYGSLLKVFKV